MKAKIDYFYGPYQKGGRTSTKKKNNQQAFELAYQQKKNKSIVPPLNFLESSPMQNQLKSILTKSNRTNRNTLPAKTSSKLSQLVSQSLKNQYNQLKPKVSPYKIPGLSSKKQNVHFKQLKGGRRNRKEKGQDI